MSCMLLTGDDDRRLGFHCPVDSYFSLECRPSLLPKWYDPFFRKGRRNSLRTCLCFLTSIGIQKFSHSICPNAILAPAASLLPKSTNALDQFLFLHIITPLLSFLRMSTASTKPGSNSPLFWDLNLEPRNNEEQGNEISDNTWGDWGRALSAAARSLTHF